ncbi:DUF3800 domain-containing protein [Streptococcus suis]|uniref:DUF3800 domain-containing protein n=1 Tax=Streptococcus suis TaxID=1307 RepID=UPI001E517C45|nr:DUF3800 domain-containing protein [Streptococcus suis]HEM3539879.1 DUF3800 domain-containing protein [Streptococcus suis]
MELKLEIYVYTDESGVFDKNHETTYVYGGVIYLNSDDRENSGRKYIAAETALRKQFTKYKKGELKASRLDNKHKAGLFRSLNEEIKFSIVVSIDRVLDRIFNEKRSKQRYLDYVYKVGLKRVFQRLIAEGKIDVTEVDTISIYTDEHSTATNGKYELREALLNEFKYGTFNQEWNTFYPPLFDTLTALTVEYCNSSKKSHIRMADIVANRAYYLAKNEMYKELEEKTIVIYFP